MRQSHLSCYPPCPYLAGEKKSLHTLKICKSNTICQRKVLSRRFCSGIYRFWHKQQLSWQVLACEEGIEGMISVRKGRRIAWRVQAVFFNTREPTKWADAGRSLLMRLLTMLSSIMLSVYRFSMHVAIYRRSTAASSAILNQWCHRPAAKTLHQCTCVLFHTASRARD